MSRKSFVNLTDGIVNVSMLIIQIKPRRLHRPAKPFKRTIHGRRSLVYSHSASSDSLPFRARCSTAFVYAFIHAFVIKFQDTSTVSWRTIASQIKLRVISGVRLLFASDKLLVQGHQRTQRGVPTLK